MLAAQARGRTVATTTRAQLEARWHGTIWEARDGHGWHRLNDRSDTSLVVISAWNPLGERLPPVLNHARDRLLGTELAQAGIIACRARGCDASGVWCEEGWQIAHQPARTLCLLARYQQFAGWLTGPDGPSLVWSAVAPAR
jgi:hypothetical protein